jgi:hypothetical protein
MWTQHTKFATPTKTTMKRVTFQRGSDTEIDWVDIPESDDPKKHVEPSLIISVGPVPACDEAGHPNKCGNASCLPSARMSNFFEGRLPLDPIGWMRKQDGLQYDSCWMTYAHRPVDENGVPPAALFTEDQTRHILAQMRDHLLNSFESTDNAFDVTVAAERESRAMFVSRLESMDQQGDKWLTVQAVLGLLNDCDMLACRALSAPALQSGESKP